jgi:uncharacterized SAM-binding protein YcdF (DUF218 family)
MQRSFARRTVRGLLRGLMVSSASVGALVALICALIVLQGQRDEARPAGAAVVLGAAQWNGVPSPVLQARLDHALDLYRRGYVKQIILTGGVGSGDTLSEAAAGRQYLLEHGIPADALLLDEEGTTTWKSLQNVAQIARTNGIGTILVVSDRFHMLRALKMARDLGLAAYGSPAQTSPIAAHSLEQARYVVREAWAYLAYLFARE